MIRNVCIHTANEQPLLCDLFDLPTADDAGLVCTNVRSMDGKRPVFIDATASTFFFPYHVVRFLEIPEAEMAKHRAAGGATPGVRRAGAPTVGAEDAIADDPANGNGHEVHVDDGSLLPVAVGVPDADTAEDADLELEIDEDFLQRIRDI